MALAMRKPICVVLPPVPPEETASYADIPDALAQGIGERQFFSKFKNPEAYDDSFSDLVPVLLTIKQSVQGDSKNTLFAEPLREDAPKAPMWYVPIDFEAVRRRFENKEYGLLSEMPIQESKYGSKFHGRGGKGVASSSSLRLLHHSASIGALPEYDGKQHGTDMSLTIAGDGSGKVLKEDREKEGGRSRSDPTVSISNSIKKAASAPELSEKRQDSGAMGRWIQARSCLKLAAVSYFNRPPLIRPKYVLVVCGKNRLHGHFAEKVKNGLVDSGIAVRVALSG